MKNYEQILLKIESLFGKHEQRDWRYYIRIIQKLVNTNITDMDLYIRVIYILHHILVEENYSVNDGKIIESLLKRYFIDSYLRFEKKSEYLFFVGKILYVAEWYFGLNDDDRPMKYRLAFKMQKAAYEKEPTNQLYKWGYLVSKNEKEESLNIALQIVSEQNVLLNWLKTKGFPGTYMIDSINSWINLAKL
jgi:hypothetical protein